MNPTDELADLLEGSYGQRDRQLPRRELVFEVGLSVLFLAAAAGLALSTGLNGLLALPALAVVAGYSVATRVAYPLGAGNLLPTPPFLVALFAVAPFGLVPLLVFGGLLLGTLVEALAGRTRLE